MWPVYTGSGTDEGIFKVEFLRESRSDVSTSTATGFEVVTKFRIDEIKASVNNEWTHKYGLSYTTADNGVRSLLDTITKSGRDEQGATIVLPTDDFDYQQNTDDWSEDTNYSLPVLFCSTVGQDLGVRLADVNGDGLQDLLYGKGGEDNSVYINDGDGTGWTEDTGFFIECRFC